MLDVRESGPKAWLCDPRRYDVDGYWFVPEICSFCSVLRFIWEVMRGDSKTCLSAVKVCEPTRHLGFEVLLEII